MAFTKQIKKIEIEQMNEEPQKKNMWTAKKKILNLIIRTTKQNNIKSGQTHFYLRRVQVQINQRT